MESKIAIVTPETVKATGRRVPIAELESPLLKNCLALWNQRKGARTFPPKEAIQPRDMAAYLRNITLYAISEDKQDFEYKIMGDAAVVAWGRSFAGMHRDDLNHLQAGMGDIIWKVCCSVVRRRLPLVLRGQLWRGDYDMTRQETIFLPLDPNDEVVTHILSVGSYEWALLTTGDQTSSPSEQ